VLVAVAATAIVGVVALAWTALDATSEVARLDRAWLASVRGYAVGHPAWLSTMEVVTHLGDTVGVFLIDAALVALCVARGRRRLALFVALTGLAGWAARIAVRELVARPRPGDALWSERTFSFPSGHTTNAAIAAGLVMIVLLPSLGRLARVAVATVAVVGALAVGFSRVAGGVHWPSDVLGGLLFAVGFVCLAAAVFPWPAADPGPPRRAGPGQPWPPRSEPSAQARPGLAGELEGRLLRVDLEHDKVDVDP
jgi:membrane-associated phospholipid phosphatase